MDEPRTTPRATGRRPVWLRISLIVGAVLAATLLSSMLLSATGIGAEGRTTGQHGSGSAMTMDASGDGHDRAGGAHSNAGERGDHAGPAQGACP